MAIPSDFDFVLKEYITKKLSRMLKPVVPKFRSDLSARLKDIAEMQVPMKLKPIVGNTQWQL